MSLKRTGIAPGKGFKPRTAPFLRAATRTKTASTAGLLRVAAVQREGKTKAIKSRGLKGRPPTADEQRFMDRIAKIGCIACLADGVENRHISIHHIDGRTKPGAHFLTLPLCGPHHQQDDSDPMGRISLHGAKKSFEARYGTQRELLAECIELISGTGTGATAPAPKHLSLEQ